MSKKCGALCRKIANSGRRMIFSIVWFWLSGVTVMSETGDRKVPGSTPSRALLLMAYSSRAWPCPRCGASPPAQKLFSTQKKDQCSEVSGLPPPNVSKCDWVSLRAFPNPEEACVLRQQWHDGDLRQESCGRRDRRNGAVCL